MSRNSAPLKRHGFSIAIIALILFAAWSLYGAHVHEKKIKEAQAVLEIQKAQLGLLLFQYRHLAREGWDSSPSSIERYKIMTDTEDLVGSGFASWEELGFSGPDDFREKMLTTTPSGS